MLDPAGASLQHLATKAVLELLVVQQMIPMLRQTYRLNNLSIAQSQSTQQVRQLLHSCITELLKQRGAFATRRMEEIFASGAKRTHSHPFSNHCLTSEG